MQYLFSFSALVLMGALSYNGLGGPAPNWAIATVVISQLVLEYRSRKIVLFKASEPPSVVVTPSYMPRRYSE